VERRASHQRAWLPRPQKSDPLFDLLPQATAAEPPPPPHPTQSCGAPASAACRAAVGVIPGHARMITPSGPFSCLTHLHWRTDSLHFNGMAVAHVQTEGVLARGHSPAACKRTASVSQAPHSSGNAHTLDRREKGREWRGVSPAYPNITAKHGQPSEAL
jgi:hypothetical protein